MYKKAARVQTLDTGLEYAVILLLGPERSFPGDISHFRVGRRARDEAYSAVRAGEWLMARFEIPIPYEAVESSSFVCGVAGNGISSAIA